MQGKKSISKKTWIIITSVALALILALTLGIVFGSRSCNSATQSGDKNNTTEHMMILEKEYTVGKPIVFDFYVYSDLQFKSVSYSINNGAATAVDTVKTGLAKDHRYYDGELGKYFVDTDVQIVDSSNMALGYYTLVIYGVTTDGATYQLSSEPYVIKIVANTPKV